MPSAALHGPDLSVDKPYLAAQLSDGIRWFSHPSNPRLSCLVDGHCLESVAISPLTLAIGLPCAFCRLPRVAPAVLPPPPRAALAKQESCGKGRSRGQRWAEAWAILGGKRCPVNC